MATHPTTDAVLLAQREKLAELTPADTPMTEQRRVVRELLWHAMFTYSALNPHANMANIAMLCQDAIRQGVTVGIKQGNHKL